MKKIILILTTTILSTAALAQFADPCDIGSCDDPLSFDFDKLKGKWQKDELEKDRVMRQLYQDTYKGVPQSAFQ